MQSFVRSRRGYLALALVAIVATAGAWYYFGRYLPSQAATPTETIKTTQVSRGDLVISASGSGELLPSAEVSLGFQSSGLLADLSVKVGDQVRVGDVLARLDDTSARADVAQAEISLRQAELDLATLTKAPTASERASAEVGLASAQSELESLTEAATSQDLAAAKDTLASAQAALETLLAGPSEQQVTIDKANLEKAEIALQQAQAAYDRSAWREDQAASPSAAALQEATIDYETAKANYELTTAAPTQESLSSARAKVADAQSALDKLTQGPTEVALSASQAKVHQAQATLDELLAGPSQENLEKAQLTVQQAKNTLTSAQVSLEKTVLKAPLDGVVTAVDASVGESVGSSAFITLQDLKTPLIRFLMDETDMANVTVDNKVNIVFTALPDDTFSGKVVRVDPALVTSNNTQAVQGWASIDLGDRPVRLLSGMTVDSVEVISAEARNALLVPVQALRQMGSGQYAVFVVQPDGQLELRNVEVGLKDEASAEIRSGLSAGEAVSTGVTTTSSNRPSAAPTPGFGGPGGGEFFMGRPD